MKILDKGVITPSFMDFQLPTDFAKKALYYTVQSGHFYCTNQYAVERDNINQYLLLYVCSGSFYAETPVDSVVADADEIILLDCCHPHRYGCKTAGDFLWFHYNGNSSDAYYAHLHDKTGILYHGSQAAMSRPWFQNVLTQGKRMPANESLISLNIDRILTTLTMPSQPIAPSNQVLSPALSYISQNYDHSLVLEELAALCNISTSHFIRIFKQQLNCTPHEYLLLYRIRQSKNLLISSSHTIEEIAEKCGFNSPSHFARAFKKINALTPTEFRSVQF